MDTRLGEQRGHVRRRVRTGFAATALATGLLAGCGSTQPARISVVTTPSASPSASPSDLVVMSSTGLGVAKFGDDAEEVIATLSKLLDAPTEDSGWTPDLAGCETSTIRNVFWGPLVVTFSSGGSSIVADQREHFLSFEFVNDTGTTPLLHTNAGIILGDSVVALKKAYPKVRISDSELEGPVFQVSDDPTSLSGNLTALTEDGVVVTLRAGVLCID
jgi:hypothetical protein